MFRSSPESEDAFIAATLENARNSVQEPGIARFDVIREASADPTRFAAGGGISRRRRRRRHKETAHYAVWRDAVADMMAVPRVQREVSESVSR